MKIGHFKRVYNLNRKFGASQYYISGYIKHDGLIVPAIFTPTELHEAMLRAEKNPEDLPKKISCWQKIKNLFP